MTCETMREQLLEAELDELGGIGSSPVAVHVRECVRCRAIAERLLADTRLLGAEVARLSPHVPPRHAPPRVAIALHRCVSRSRYLTIGTLAAAALAFVIVMHGRHRDVALVAPVTTHSVSTTGPSRVASTISPSTPAAVNKGSANTEERVPATQAARVMKTMPVARPPVARTSVEHAVQPRPLPAAQPVTPTSLASRAAAPPLVVAEAQPLVSVTPPPGKRAAIMRTPDPAITVVWLY